MKLPAQRVRCVQIVKGESARIRPPFNDGDRLDDVMTALAEREAAEAAAGAFVRDIQMEIRSC